MSNQTLVTLFRFLADNCAMKFWPVEYSWAEVQFSCGTFKKQLCEHFVPCLYPFYLPANWNADTMTGKEAGVSNHHWFLRENPGCTSTLKQKYHVSPGLPDFKLLHKRYMRFIVCLLVLSHCFSKSLSCSAEQSPRLYYTYCISFNT